MRKSYTHTGTHTNTNTPVCTVSNVSIHITVQYPESAQRQPRQHFSFIFIGPYIHDTIASSQRWAEKKDRH